MNARTTYAEAGTFWARPCSPRAATRKLRLVSARERAPTSRRGHACRHARGVVREVGRDEGRLAPLYFASVREGVASDSGGGRRGVVGGRRAVLAGGRRLRPRGAARRPFELLAGVSTADVLSPETAALRAARRTGMFDTLQGATIDWSLAGPVDCVLFGRHCSREAFGHGGSQSSMVMADPAHGLALAVICNGKCGGPQHNARMGRIAAAVYADLGISGTGDAARHEMPSYG